MNDYKRLDLSKWKLFRFDSVFSYKRGKRYIKEDHSFGDIAYISSTKNNNGIDAYVSPPDYMKVYKNKITLNNSGSVGYCFYHPYEFVCSDHCTVIDILCEKQELNIYIAIFLKPIIEKFKDKYVFSREISDERLKKETIMLPIDENENPDWQFMEDFIKKSSTNVVFDDQKKMKNISENKKIKMFNLDINKWQYFHLAEYFNMFAGKYYEDYNQGNTPLVSSSDTNNGVMHMIDISPAFNGNMLTIGKIGATTYYQKEPFLATSDVTVLAPKFKCFNKYIGLFMATIINQEGCKWSYGRQIRLGDSKKLKIKLPVDKNGNPDWQFMENYIKSLPYSANL